MESDNRVGITHGKGKSNQNGDSKCDMGFGTLAIHYAQEPETVTGAVIPPIFLSTTFAQEPYKGHKGYEYSRSGNPTRNALEKSIAKLEGAKYGFLFSSGLGSISTFFNTLPKDTDVIFCNDVYGGTQRYLLKIANNLNISARMVDFSSIDNVVSSLRSNTGVVWIETPTNPTLRIIDIASVAKAVKRFNPNILLVVDNTMMSPYFQKPLNLGADVVSHSVTKYINGHSDVVMGAIVTNNDEFAEKLRYFQNAVGSVPSPMDCFLAHRGLKTLHLRMKKCEENAFEIAKLLEASPIVCSVNYPGLKSHPQHAIALKQQTGFGGMISFTIKGDTRHSRKFLETLELFHYGESLGGIESLIEVPALMTHSSVPEEKRKELGIIDTFIRMSVGIEEKEDLIRDVNNALSATQDIED